MRWFDWISFCLRLRNSSAFADVSTNYHLESIMNDVDIVFLRTMLLFFSAFCVASIYIQTFRWNRFIIIVAPNAMTTYKIFNSLANCVSADKIFMGGGRLPPAVGEVSPCLSNGISSDEEEGSVCQMYYANIESIVITRRLCRGDGMIINAWKTIAARVIKFHTSK